MNLKSMKTKRAKLFREAEDLKQADGTFKDDETRAAFDAKMTEVEELDADIRREERGESEYLNERPANGSRRERAATNPEDENEPNERDMGADQERDRVTGIMDSCRAARMPKAFERKLIDEKVSLLEAQKRIFKELAVRDDPRGNEGPNAGARGTRIEMGEDPFVHRRAGIENALLHKVNAEKFALTTDGREYRGMSLLDIGRAYLNAQGIRTTDMSKMDLAGAALGLVTVRGSGGMHTTSDFPLLLADVASKSLRAEYDAAPQTFEPFTRRGTVPDFKLANRVQIGDAPALQPLGEHGEYSRGSIEEGREQVQAATYGRVFAITRKALVNDDLNAFARVPMKFGRMAKNLESDLVYYQLLNNAAMGDGVALFHASHANYVGAGDIDITNVSAGEEAMLLQTGIDGTTLISVAPKILLVPPGKKTKAEQFVSTAKLATTDDNVNPFAGKLMVVCEARLQRGVTIGEGGSQLTATGSAFAWYLVADKNAIDIIELVFLEGQEAPVVESRIGFDIDGLEIKCRHDVGAKAIDWRGLYKSDGSDES